MARAKDDAGSGSNADDIYEAALKKFHDVMLKVFSFQHVFSIVKDSPKFQDLRKPDPSPTGGELVSGDSDSDTEAKPGPTKLVRLMGNKQAKRQKKNPSNDDADTRRIIAQAQMEKAKASALKANMALFTAPLEGLSDVARRFFELAQANVLKEMQGNDPADLGGEDIDGIEN